MPEIMRHLSKALGLLVLFFVLAMPASARALDSLVLGGDLSYAHQFTGDGLHGGGAGFHVWYSFTDYIAVGSTVAWAGHAAPSADGDETELRHVITAAAGMYFIADIIRFVPYLGLLSGVAVSIQDETQVDYLLNIALGADVLINASFTTGVELTYQLLVGDEVVPARLVASVRLNWRHIIF